MPAANSASLEERKPAPLQRLAISAIHFSEIVHLPWYKWPNFTVVPFVYLLIRRRLLTLNLIDVPQPPNTPLAERLRLTPTLRDEDRPLFRTDDAWGNDGQHPGAGSYRATIGRNMKMSPESQCNAPLQRYAAVLSPSRQKKIQHCFAGGVRQHSEQAAPLKCLLRTPQPYLLLAGNLNNDIVVPNLL
jgi:hypothetical protein